MRNLLLIRDGLETKPVLGIGRNMLPNRRVSKTRIYLFPVMKIVTHPLVKKVLFCIAIHVVLRKFIIRMVIIQVMIKLKVKDENIKVFLKIADIIIDALIAQTSIAFILDVLYTFLIDETRGSYGFGDHLTEFFRKYVHVSEREDYFRLSILDRRNPFFNAKITENYMMNQLGDYDPRHINSILGKLRKLDHTELVRKAVTAVKTCNTRLALTEVARILIQSFPPLENDMVRFGNFRSTLLALEEPVARANQLLFIAQYLKKNNLFIDALRDPEEKKSAAIMLLGEIIYLTGKLKTKCENVLTTPMFQNETLANNSQQVISSVADAIKKIKTK